VFLPKLGKLCFVSLGPASFMAFALLGPSRPFPQFFHELGFDRIGGFFACCLRLGLGLCLGRSEHPDQLGHEEKAFPAFHADLIASDLAGGNLALDGALTGAEKPGGLGQGDIGLCHGVPVTG